MTKLIEINNVKVNWFEGYANTPEIIFDVEDPVDLPERICHAIDLPSVKQESVSKGMIADILGVVFYGVFYSERDRCGPTATSNWNTPLKYYEGEEVKEFTPYSYGASRATFMKTIAPDNFPNIFDVKINSSIGNAVTEPPSS